MKCLTLSKLIAYQSSLSAEAEREEIRNHLDSCTVCQQKLNAYSNLKKFMWQNAPMPSSRRPEACYDPLDFGAYLEGGLAGRSRKQLHRHLAHCPLCLDNLLALKGLQNELKAEGFIATGSSSKENIKDVMTAISQTVLDGLRGFADILRSPRPTYGWLGTAVIVIAVLFVVIRLDRTGRMPFATRDRAEAANETQIDLLSPPRRSDVDAPRPEFRWTGPSQIMAFNFLLLDMNSEIVWEEETNTNHFTLPSEVALLPNMTYFWQVEGRFESGNTLLSKMASFTYKRD